MADLLSYALTTVADVKESLGISSGDTSKDNLIKRKINQATEMIEGYVGLPADHHFKQGTYTNEPYNSLSSNQIILGMRPVSSITSFQRLDGSDSDSGYSDVESQDYFLDENAGIVNLNFTTSGRWDSYRFTYVAGYSTIPADLAEACVILAGYLVENASSGGTAVKRKTEGQRSVEYFDPGQQSSNSLFEQLGVDDMLSRYMRYPVTP